MKVRRTCSWCRKPPADSNSFGSSPCLVVGHLLGAPRRRVQVGTVSAGGISHGRTEGDLFRRGRRPRGPPPSCRLTRVVALPRPGSLPDQNLPPQHRQGTPAPWLKMPCSLQGVETHTPRPAPSRSAGSHLSGHPEGQVVAGSADSHRPAQVSACWFAGCRQRLTARCTHVCNTASKPC